MDLRSRGQPQDSICPFLIHPVSQEYGSNNVWFIHREDGRRLCTGQGNIYLIHIKDVQHILSIHKYDQAYHDKQKSNEMIATKVACPQRLMIVLPLGMYPI